MVRWLLIGLAILFMVFFLLMPLATVFYEALRAGLATYVQGISDPEAIAAIKLTLLVAGDRRAGESRLRRGRVLGDRQIRAFAARAS